MQRSRGTGPRATGKKRRHFYVGRGPVPRHAAIAGDRPPRYGNKNGSWHRRAWALGCHTRIREGFPRHAAIAGDRPPRYGNKNGSWHPRAPAIREKNSLILIRSRSGELELQRGPMPFSSDIYNRDTIAGIFHTRMIMPTSKMRYHTMRLRMRVRLKMGRRGRCSFMFLLFARLTFLPRG